MEQVYAPTFPGYGRAEKPAVSYSAELWRDFLRDFVLQVPLPHSPSPRGFMAYVLNLLTSVSAYFAPFLTEIWFDLPQKPH